ncbi:MAG: TetR/AcrR family transcriptional regulator [Pseudomonadota bacterium]
MATDTPLLHRDDPTREPLSGHVKVTREDWLAIARDVLVTEGVEQVKILALAEQLQVSRSSFYWYFKNRDDLLTALLSHWEAGNTNRVIEHCQMPGASISAAICNFFRCFIDPTRFDRGLDFAVREWARRDSDLRQRVDLADANRIAAVTDMFARFDYPPDEADARARILYFMQLGYHALDVREDMDTRLSRIESYLFGFSGTEADPDAVATFHADIRALGLN